MVTENSPRVVVQQRLSLPCYGEYSGYHQCQLEEGASQYFSNLIYQSRGAPQPNDPRARLVVRQAWQCLPGPGQLTKEKLKGVIYDPKYAFFPTIPSWGIKDNIVHFRADALFQGEPIVEDAPWLDIYTAGFDRKEASRTQKSLKLYHRRTNSTIYTDRAISGADAHDDRMYIDFESQAKQFANAKELTNAAYRMFQSNGVYFNNQYFLSYQKHPIYALKPIQRTNSQLLGITKYTDWNTSAGLAIAGFTEPKWTIAGVSDASTRWSSVDRFEIFQDDMLLAYGDGPQIYWQSPRLVNNELHFNELNIRNISGEVVSRADLNVYTVISHKRKLEEGTFQNALVVITDNFHLILLVLDTSKSPTTWRRVLSTKLPAPMLGRGAYTKTSGGDIFIVLASGIHSLNAILQGDAPAIGNFNGEGFLHGAEWATLAFSSKYSSYFLELFQLNNDDFSVKSALWTGHDSSLAWSRVLLPDSTQSENGSIIHSQQRQLRQVWGEPVWINTRPNDYITLPHGTKTDTWGLRANNVLFHANHVFSSISNSDIVPQYELVSGQRSRTISVLPVKYLFHSPNVFSASSDRLHVVSLMYIGSPFYGKITHVFNNQPYAWPGNLHSAPTKEEDMTFGDYQFSDAPEPSLVSANAASQEASIKVNLEVSSVACEDFYAIIGGATYTPHSIRAIYCERLEERKQ